MTLLAAFDLVNSAVALITAVMRALVYLDPKAYSDWTRQECFLQAALNPFGQCCVLLNASLHNYQLILAGIMVSQYANAALTLDRVLAVSRPTEYRLWSHGRLVKWAAALITFMGFLTCALLLVVQQLKCQRQCRHFYTVDACLSGHGSAGTRAVLRHCCSGRRGIQAELGAAVQLYRLRRRRAHYQAAADGTTCICECQYQLDY